MSLQKSFVLGGLEHIKYQLNELILGKVDKLFIYTETRLKETMNARKDFDEGVKQDIKELINGMAQSDDITMMILRYNGYEDNVTVQGDEV